MNHESVDQQGKIFADVGVKQVKRPGLETHRYLQNGAHRANHFVSSYGRINTSAHPHLTVGHLHELALRCSSVEEQYRTACDLSTKGRGGKQDRTRRSIVESFGREDRETKIRHDKGRGALGDLETRSRFHGQRSVIQTERSQTPRMKEIALDARYSKQANIETHSEMLSHAH